MYKMLSTSYLVYHILFTFINSIMTKMGSSFFTAFFSVVCCSCCFFNFSKFSHFHYSSSKRLGRVGYLIPIWHTFNVRRNREHFHRALHEKERRRIWYRYFQIQQRCAVLCQQRCRTVQTMMLKITNCDAGVVWRQHRWTRQKRDLFDRCFEVGTKKLTSRTMILTIRFTIHVRNSNKRMGFGDSFF